MSPTSWYQWWVQFVVTESTSQEDKLHFKKLSLGTAPEFLEFSRDGQRLLTVNYQVIRVWDMATLDQLVVLEHQKMNLNHATISADGKFVAAADWTDNSLLVWDVLSGSVIQTLYGHQDMPLRVKFSPDGTALVSASKDQSIRIWDWRKGKLLRVLLGHTGSIMALDISGDGKRIATGSADQTVRIWAFNSGSAKRVLTGINGIVHRLSFNHDGSLVAAGTIDLSRGEPQPTEVRVWETHGAHEVFGPLMHLGSIRGLAFSSDGMVLATSDDHDAVRFFHAQSGTELWTWPLQELTGSDRLSIQGIAFAALGFGLAVSYSDGVLFVDSKPPLESIQVSEVELLVQFDVEVGSMVLSQDASLMIVGLKDGSVRIWDTNRSLEITTLGDEGNPTSLAYHEAAQTVATAYWSVNPAENRIIVWDLKHGTVPCLITAGQALSSIAFHKGHESLAVGTRQGNALFYEIASGSKLPLEFTGGRDDTLYINSAGDLMLSLSGAPDSVLRIWRLETSTLERQITFNELTGSGSFFVAASWISDSLFVTGEDSGTIRVWDAVTGEMLARLEGHTNSAWCFTATKDAQLLISGSWDGTIRYWDLQSKLEERRVELGGHVMGIGCNADGSVVLAVLRDGRVFKIS
jgi:WD40 repeat protein